MTNALKRKLRHWRRWVTDDAYRRQVAERHRLQNMDRYESGITTMLGPPTRLVDAASFLSAYQAIFEEEIYRFEPDEAPPTIIDGGANIGLATLYWKRQFPSARITALEPDPNLFRVLRQNVHEHGHDDVTLVQKGLWSEKKTLEFQPDGADAGQIAEGKGTDESKYSVTTTSLVPFLEERVDMVKLDIEGAEVEVLREADGHLDVVQHLFVEYHSYVGEEQQIDEVFRILHDAGFRVHVQPELVADRPFVDRLESYGMDHRLNIFAYRR